MALLIPPLFVMRIDRLLICAGGRMNELRVSGESGAVAEMREKVLAAMGGTSALPQPRQHPPPNARLPTQRINIPLGLPPLMGPILPALCGPAPFDRPPPMFPVPLTTSRVPWTARIACDFIVEAVMNSRHGCLSVDVLFDLYCGSPLPKSPEFFQNWDGFIERNARQGGYLHDRLIIVDGTLYLPQCSPLVGVEVKKEEEQMSSVAQSMRIEEKKEKAVEQDKDTKQKKEREKEKEGKETLQLAVPCDHNMNLEKSGMKKEEGGKKVVEQQQKEQEEKENVWQRLGQIESDCTLSQGELKRLCVSAWSGVTPYLPDLLYMLKAVIAFRRERGLDAIFASCELKSVLDEWICAQTEGSKNTIDLSQFGLTDVAQLIEYQFVQTNAEGMARVHPVIGCLEFVEMSTEEGVAEECLRLLRDSEEHRLSGLAIQIMPRLGGDRKLSTGELAKLLLRHPGIFDVQNHMVEEKRGDRFIIV